MTAALLHCHEIPLAELVPAHGEDDAAAFAAGGGVPVVLKADVPGLVHKTEPAGSNSTCAPKPKSPPFFG